MAICPWMSDPADRAYEESMAVAYASQGTASYRRYWDGCSRYWRCYLWQSGIHDQLKRLAEAEDKKRVLSPAHKEQDKE